jgi:hypothetical protein
LTIQPATVRLRYNSTQTFRPRIFRPKYFWTIVLFDRPTIQSCIFRPPCLLCRLIVTCNKTSTLCFPVVTLYPIQAGSKCYMKNGQSDRIDRSPPTHG